MADVLMRAGLRHGTVAVALALSWVFLVAGLAAAQESRTVQLVAPPGFPDALREALTLELASRSYTLQAASAEAAVSAVLLVREERRLAASAGVATTPGPADGDTSAITVVSLSDTRAEVDRLVRLEGALSELRPRVFALAAGSMLDALPLPPPPETMDEARDADASAPDAGAAPSREAGSPDDLAPPPRGAGVPPSQTPAERSASVRPLDQATAQARSRVSEAQTGAPERREPSLGLYFRLASGVATEVADAKNLSVPLTVGLGLQLSDRWRAEAATTLRSAVGSSATPSLLEGARLSLFWDLPDDSSRFSLGVTSALQFVNGGLGLSVGLSAEFAWRISASILFGPRVTIGYETTADDFGRPPGRDAFVVSGTLNLFFELD